jgi:hypothetical protein
MDLDVEEAQYFIDVTGARALSGYGTAVDTVSIHLDKAFFNLCQDEDNVIKSWKNYMKITTYVNSLISDCIIKRRSSDE